MRSRLWVVYVYPVVTMNVLMVCTPSPGTLCCCCTKLVSYCYFAIVQLCTHPTAHIVMFAIGAVISSIRIQIFVLLLDPGIFVPF